MAFFKADDKSVPRLFKSYISFLNLLFIRNEEDQNLVEIIEKVILFVLISLF